MGWVILEYVIFILAFYLAGSFTYGIIKTFPNTTKATVATTFYWWIAIFLAIGSLYSVYHLLWLMPLFLLLGTIFVTAWVKPNHGILATLLIPLIPAGTILWLLIYFSDSAFVFPPELIMTIPEGVTFLLNMLPPPWQEAIIKYLEIFIKGCFVIQAIRMITQVRVSMMTSHLSFTVFFSLAVLLSLKFYSAYHLLWLIPALIVINSACLTCVPFLKEEPLNTDGHTVRNAIAAILAPLIPMGIMLGVLINYSR